MSRTIRYLTEQEQQQRSEQENRDNAIHHYLDIVLRIDYLKSQLDSGKGGLDFPWNEYEQLQHTARLISSRHNLTGGSEGEHAHEATAFPVNNDQIHVPPVLEVSSAFHLPPLASEESALAGLPTLAKENDFSHSEGAPQGLPTDDIANKGPIQKEVVPTLESLCKVKGEKQKAEHAAKIDNMWEELKSKTPASRHSTACAAVYKMAVWLELVFEETPAREWQAMLLDRYKVSVSEAQSKYRIKKPTSDVFRAAVLTAFAVAKRSFALAAKGHPLPAIYQ